MRKLQGPEVSGASAEDMAAAMAMYPQMKDAMARMSAESVKLAGTPIATSTTIDAVQSTEQAAQQPRQSDDDSKSGGPGGIGGLLGGVAKKGQKKSDNSDKPEEGQAKGRSTFMTMTGEVLKVSTEVSAADLALLPHLPYPPAFRAASTGRR